MHEGRACLVEGLRQIDLGLNKIGTADAGLCLRQKHVNYIGKGRPDLLEYTPRVIRVEVSTMA